jgi:hypothetical protein
VSNPHGRPKGSKNDPDNRLPFKQSELQKAIRACVRTNVQIEQIIINATDGTFVIRPVRMMPEPRERAT